MRSSSPRRTAIALVLLALTPGAYAAEQAEAQPAPVAPSASAVRGSQLPEDPLDKISRRLAERLGASRPIDSKGTLRISSRAAASEPARAPHRGASAASQRAPRMITELRAPEPPREIPWSYEGPGGPEAWARLKPEFVLCGSGKRQSPIDIRDGIKVGLDPIQFDYKPSGFSVIDNGHTVQVNVSPGSTLEVIGRRYELVEFHFHRPSEERVNGRTYDMSAHLLHKDAEGRLAMVAVLLERGGAQPVVQQVWNNLPLERGEEVPARGTLDPRQLLPEDRGYFTYMGSMTTPPCSEGVLWMVMKQPVGISPDQISIFSRLYPMNARPVQPAGGRLIKESN